MSWWFGWISIIKWIDDWNSGYYRWSEWLEGIFVEWEESIIIQSRQFIEIIIREGYENIGIIRSIKSKE